MCGRFKTAAFFFWLLVPLVATSALAQAPGAGTSAELYLAVPPPDITPVDDVPDGILNPDFEPDCDYIQGEYDCGEFSTSYCEQFPSGPKDCRIILFWGFKDGSAGHAANITRVRNADGTYTYCMVEPQTNSVVEGSCWVGNETWPRDVPSHLQRAICEAYESEELECVETPDGPRLRPRPKPRIVPHIPWWISGTAPGEPTISGY